MEPFVRKCQVDFVHTSGGRTTGGSERIRGDAGNMVTWAQERAPHSDRRWRRGGIAEEEVVSCLCVRTQVHQASGRGIIADTGYGVGGVSMGHVASWDDEATLLARIADGVVAVTQVSSLRPPLQLPRL